MARDPEQLMERILQSPPFVKAKKARKLLAFLVKNRDRIVSGPEISKELWNLPGNQHDGEHVRERVHDLRERLRRIEEVTDSTFYFEIPDAAVCGGYRVAFPERKGRAASAGFWRPHTKADDVRVIYPEPVFYFDPITAKYIRYYDTNPSEYRSAVGELEARHGKDLCPLYGLPLSEHVAPRCVFVGIGEVAALDMLAEWFLHRSFLKVRRQASSRTTSVLEGCPILIGSERTNHFIEELLNSEEGQEFGYRLHADIGFVTIRNAKEKEKAALQKFSVREENDGQIVAGHAPTLSIKRDRLAILYRMPTPGGRGTITMISSDTSLAVQQVAKVLTDDEEAGNIMQLTGWSELTMPRSFEMLFAVRVAPTSMEHEAGEATLLGWRECRNEGIEALNKGKGYLSVAAEAANASALSIPPP